MMKRNVLNSKGNLYLFITVLALSLLAFPFASWGEPLSMGRIDLMGPAHVRAGDGLVFQSPDDAEAPLMEGSVVQTMPNGQALVDWKGKCAASLEGNGQAGFDRHSLNLSKGTMIVRVRPGKKVNVRALDSRLEIKAPSRSAGIAKLVIRGDNVRVISNTAKVTGVDANNRKVVLLSRQSKTLCGCRARNGVAHPHHPPRHHHGHHHGHHSHPCHHCWGYCHHHCPSPWHP